MPDTDNKKKKTIWDHIKSTNGKIALVIALFVGYQELRPIIKDVLGLDDDIEAVIEKCNSYTDEAIHNKEDKAQVYLDILLDDVYRINKRYERDSLEYAQKHQKFAVGFRSDLDGIMSYRDRFGNDCSTRINHQSQEVEFYNKRKDKWDRCFFEDL